MAWCTHALLLHLGSSRFCSCHMHTHLPWGPEEKVWLYTTSSTTRQPWRRVSAQHTSGAGGQRQCLEGEVLLSVSEHESRANTGHLALHWSSVSQYWTSGQAAAHLHRCTQHAHDSHLADVLLSFTHLCMQSCDHLSELPDARRSIRLSGV